MSTFFKKVDRNSSLASSLLSSQVVKIQGFTLPDIRVVISSSYIRRLF